MSIYSTAYNGAGKRKASEITHFNNVDEVKAIMGDQCLHSSSRSVIYGEHDGDRVIYSDYIVTKVDDYGA